MFNQEFIKDLYAVLKKHGIKQNSFVFVGQKDEELKIKNIIDNPSSYDVKTYGNPKVYAEFLERGKDQKYVWIMVSSPPADWKIPRKEMLTAYDDRSLVFPDRDPTSGCLLNYGLGNNRVTIHNEFIPSIGHKLSRNAIKVKGLDIADNDLTNIEIESVQTNMYKNKGNELSRMQLIVKDIYDLHNKIA